MPLAYMLGNLSFSEYEQATICHRGNDFLGRRRAQTAGAGAQMNAAMQKVHTVDGVKAVRDHIKIAPAS